MRGLPCASPDYSDYSADYSFDDYSTDADWATIAGQQGGGLDRGRLFVGGGATAIAMDRRAIAIAIADAPDDANYYWIAHVENSIAAASDADEAAAAAGRPSLRGLRGRHCGRPSEPRLGEVDLMGRRIVRGIYGMGWEGVDGSQCARHGK